MAWIERKKDFIKRPQREKKKVDFPKGDYGDTVIWKPVECPTCGITRLKCMRTDGRLRYHICLECGTRFKSIEKKGKLCRNCQKNPFGQEEIRDF
jgi:hypothetical protein